MPTLVNIDQAFLEIWWIIFINIYMYIQKKSFLLNATILLKIVKIGHQPNKIVSYFFKLSITQEAIERPFGIRPYLYRFYCGY